MPSWEGIDNMRRRNVRIVLGLATAAAWGFAIAAIWLVPLRPAVAVFTGAGVAGAIIVKDGDRSHLVGALADACTALRKQSGA